MEFELIEQELMNVPETVTLGYQAELGSARFEGETAVFAGKVFEAGSYPVQQIEMTPNDNRGACAAFLPCPIKDTHDDEQSVFRGRLGQWTHAFTPNGDEVHAQLAVPSALVGLFGKGWRPKVSVEIDRRTKQFSAIALLNYPQVTDAQVRAAFGLASPVGPVEETKGSLGGLDARSSRREMNSSEGGPSLVGRDRFGGATPGIQASIAQQTVEQAEFTGARHSAEDREHVQAIHDHSCALGACCEGAAMGARHSQADCDAIQHLHDLAVGQGATCQPAPTTSKEKPMKTEPGRFEKMLAFFGFKPEPEAKLYRYPLPAGIKDPEARIAKFEEELLKQQALNLDSAAARFANDVIYNRRKAHPTEIEKAMVAQQYRFAVAKDGENGQAAFGMDGHLIEGEAVRQLSAYWDAKPTIALFGQQIQDKSTTDAVLTAQQRAAQRLAAATGAYNRGGY